MKAGSRIENIRILVITLIGYMLLTGSAVAQGDQKHSSFGHEHVNRNASAPHISSYLMKKRRHCAMGVEFEGQRFPFDFYQVNRGTGMLEGKLERRYLPEYDVIIKIHHANRVEGDFIEADVRDFTIYEYSNVLGDYTEVNCKRKLRLRRTGIIVTSVGAGVLAYIGVLSTSLGLFN